MLPAPRAEATNYNKDLIEQQAQALGEVQAVAPTLTLDSEINANLDTIYLAKYSPLNPFVDQSLLINQLNLFVGCLTLSNIETLSNVVLLLFSVFPKLHPIVTGKQIGRAHV